MSSLAEVEANLSERTKMVYFETPTNPMMRVADIRRIAALAKRAGAITVVDNTFLTPYFQRPLALGADIALYSATKFLCGHHDTSAGLLVTSDVSLADRLALISRTEGAALSPFDAFLIQRGMKTLALRMEKHQQNARAVAAFLKDHPSVAEVFWPGDEDSPDYALSCSQSTGFGGMLSFALKTREQALSLLENVKLIKFAESLGGTESLLPTRSHRRTPQRPRRCAKSWGSPTGWYACLSELNKKTTLSATYLSHCALDKPQNARYNKHIQENTGCFGAFRVLRLRLYPHNLIRIMPTEEVHSFCKDACAVPFFIIRHGAFFARRPCVFRGCPRDLIRKRS